METNQRKVLSPSTEVSAKCQWIHANWRFIRFIMGCLDITEMYPCGCTSHEVIAFSVETYKEVYCDVWITQREIDIHNESPLG